MSDIFFSTSPTDPAAQPLIQDLIREYDGRYGDIPGRDPAIVELHRYAPELFLPPRGHFLLLLRGGEPIAGGAFMPHAEPETAEVKRVWARSDLRRQGLAARVVRELERLAWDQGYRRFYLTTGSRQPEAVGLYRSLGYEPHFDLNVDATQFSHLPFRKRLVAPAGRVAEALAFSA
ncbi:GNAT family N-acetyltransferase [Bosea sp. CS1GBMeth4]|uniref:GNAT family N-acetyltransferase n=1 Tax=Bosea sp. CS1GBMeth4 TaxID=1892849 RepID=UPI0016455A7E|nr:GNAT family N-acetyltransferase [Bosea sp. CS1GBMeth4]